MKKKIILLIILLSIFMIGAVSAQEIVKDDAKISDKKVNEVVTSDNHDTKIATNYNDAPKIQTTKNNKKISSIKQDTKLKAIEKNERNVVSKSVGQNEVLRMDGPLTAEEYLQYEDWYEEVYWDTYHKDLPCNYKVNVKLTPDKKITADYGSGKNFKIKVTNSKTNKAMPNIILTLKIYTGKKYKTENILTNSKGIAYYSTSPLSLGEHKIVVNVNKKTKHVLGKTQTGYVTIKNVNGKLTTKPLTTSYGSGKYFKVKLVNAKTKKEIKDAKISLKIYTGKKYKTATITTDSKGIAKYDTSQLSVGKHKVVIDVKNKKAISAKSKTSSIEIKKCNLNIISPVNYSQGANKLFIVTVRNKDTGNKLSGINVSIKVYTGNSYQIYNVKTDSKGIASINTKSLSSGIHKVVVQVKGVNYNTASTKSTITIKHKTQFGTPEYSYTYSANGLSRSTNVKIDLYDENGNILNKPIIATVVDIDDEGGEHWHEEENYISGDTIGVHGYDTINGRPPVDRYLKITFKGDNLYEASTVIIN